MNDQNESDTPEKAVASEALFSSLRCEVCDSPLTEGKAIMWKPRSVGPSTIMRQGSGPYCSIECCRKKHPQTDMMIRKARQKGLRHVEENASVMARPDGVPNT